MKSFKKTAALFLAVLMLFAVSAAAAEPDRKESYTVDPQSSAYLACQEAAADMQARQILVYDATNDALLYTLGGETAKLYPASITKLFSAWVALQHLTPEEEVTAGDELDLVQAGSSMAYIYFGQTVTVSMAVEAMMLPSGNDAALILSAAAGRRIAGDEDLPAQEAVAAFVDEMNRQAKALGFENSHFANPDGYHVGTHYTCAADMARIARLALENQTIAQYMKVHEADVTYASGQTNHWENTNLFLDPEEPFYRSDAIGMKTGNTRQAGSCLMSAFKVGSRTLVVGVFGYADGEQRFWDTIELVEAVRKYL